MLPIPSNLLSLLECPACRNQLRQAPDYLWCAECGRQYAEREGVVLMHPTASDAAPATLDDFHRDRQTHANHYSQYEDRLALAGQTAPAGVQEVSRQHGLRFSQFHAELLMPHLHQARVADIGCGTLPYLRAFRHDALAAYVGVDMDYAALVAARAYYQARFPLLLLQYPIDSTPLASASIDAVISCEVLEHVAQPHRYLAELYRICKPGGWLSLSTPCSSIYWYPHNLAYLLKPGRWQKKLHAHRHWQEALAWHPALQPAILRQWLAAAGFTVVRHETRLWYFYSPTRPVQRLCELLERAGLKSAPRLFDAYIQLTDRMLRSNLPLLKWCGSRQFVLCRKIRDGLGSRS